MLSKVRARHGIDLPVEKWTKSYGLGVVLGALAILFIVVPVIVVVLKGLVEHTAITAIGLASGVLTLFALGLFVRT